MNIISPGLNLITFECQCCKKCKFRTIIDVYDGKKNFYIIHDGLDLENKDGNEDLREGRSEGGGWS